MNNKEIYLYGTVLALAEEQENAIKQLALGKLGFFGKSRIQSRGREIDKFLEKIKLNKKQLGVIDINESIISDLESIRLGKLQRMYASDVIEMVRAYL